MVALLDTAKNFLGLGQIPDPGAKTPESRLTSAHDARRLLNSCLREDIDRSKERAIVKGCVDGNPPYPEPRPAERKWECNLNWMKGRAIMNRTAVPYFNLFARVDYFADCRTAYQPDNTDFEQWSSDISLRFHNMLKRWKPGFNFNVQQTSFWMRLHGIGFAYFDKGYDWRFRSVETGNVLAPKGSPSCLDKRIPYIFVRVPYRITELWSKIKDPGAAKKVGANVEAIRNAIKYGMRGMFGNPNGANDWYARPWEEYQRILTNSDLIASFTDGDMVNCTEMLLLEYSGKISKFVFTDFVVSGQENPNAAAPGTAHASDITAQFLFADPNAYDEYQDCLVPFFRNTGDGTWHSVRGYAMEAFKHLEAENRLLCRGVDRAFLNSSVLWQYPNERDRTMGQLVRVQGCIVALPSKGEGKQVLLQGGTEDLTLMQRLLSNHLDSNLGVGSPRSMSREDGKGEQPTARQVDYTAANEASITEGEITIYYEQLDSLYATMFKRAADPSTSDAEAKQFQKECKEDGVPAAALADMEYVRANRQNGYGSPEMGIMKMRQMIDIVPMLPEDGKQNFVEDYVTQTAGPEKTKRYAPKQHIPDDQDWQATVENQMIAGGRLPVLSSGQDDVIHLQHHFEDAQQTLAPTAQSLQSGNGQPPDPAALQQDNQYAQIMAQHVEEHINRLSKDPSRKDAAKLYQDQFRQLAQYSQVLWRALRTATRQQQVVQEQAGQATSLNALDQAKVQSVQTQTALAAQKTQSQIQNQRAKTVQAMALKEAKARQDLKHSAQQQAIEVPADALAGPAKFTE